MRFVWSFTHLWRRCHDSFNNLSLIVLENHKEVDYTTELHEQSCAIAFKSNMKAHQLRGFTLDVPLEKILSSGTLPLHPELQICPFCPNEKIL